MLPSLTSIRRVSARTKVDLPQPDSPTRPDGLALVDDEAHIVDGVHLRQLFRPAGEAPLQPRPRPRPAADRKQFRDFGNVEQDGHAALSVGARASAARGQRIPAGDDMLGAGRGLRQRLRAGVDLARAALGIAARRQIGAAQIGQRAGNRRELVEARGRIRRRGDQLGRIGMPRMREQLLGRRVLDHVAGMHDDDARRALAGERQIVGDEDRRHAHLAGEIVDQIHDHRLRGDVEAGGRLVGDQQRRLCRQRDRDHDALAHAAGHFERIGLGAPRRIGDADRAQHLDGLRRAPRGAARCRGGSARRRSGGRPGGSD